jgi:hypothetical protein
VTTGTSALRAQRYSSPQPPEHPAQHIEELVMSNRKTLKIRLAVLFVASLALAAPSSAAFAAHGYIPKAKPAPASNLHASVGGNLPCHCGPTPPPKG